MRRLVSAVPLMALLTWCLGENAIAVPLITQDGAAVVDTTPLTEISASSLNTALVPELTFTPGPSPADILSVKDYLPGSRLDAGGVSGGAAIIATYTNGAPLSSGHQLHWIQIVDSNVPPSGVDGLPFYPFATASGNTSTMEDFSRRFTAHLSTIDPITFDAKLYPVDWNGTNAAVVHNGIQWGWVMTSATKGTSSGAFSNPSPSCPPATCFASGSSFAWGQPLPGSTSSSLTFNPTSFNPRPGDVFSLGTLTFVNGTIANGTGVGSVNLDIGVNFLNASQLSQTLHTMLTLVNTPNTTGDPCLDADYVFFSSGHFNTRFNVCEGGIASAELLARIESSSSLPITTGLVNASSDIPDPAQNVAFDIELVGWGEVTGDGFISETPEPVTLLLLGTTMAGLGLAARWRRRWQN